MLSCSGGWVDAFLVVFLARRGWVVAGAGGGGATFESSV